MKNYCTYTYVGVFCTHMCVIRRRRKFSNEFPKFVVVRIAATFRTFHLLSRIPRRRIMFRQFRIQFRNRGGIIPVRDRLCSRPESIFLFSEDKCFFLPADVVVFLDYFNRSLLTYTCNVLLYSKYVRKKNKNIFYNHPFFTFPLD